MTVTFSDVEQAILRRVDEHISNGGAQQRVDVYDPGGNGMRVAWGGTLEELRSELISRINNPSWYWLCEIIDVQDLHPTDLDEIPQYGTQSSSFRLRMFTTNLVPVFPFCLHGNLPRGICCNSDTVENRVSTEV